MVVVDFVIVGCGWFWKDSIQIKTWIGFMADQGLEGSQPVDLSKHPSGIVPTLQWVSLNSMFSQFWVVIASNEIMMMMMMMSNCAVSDVCFGWFDLNEWCEFVLWCGMWVCLFVIKMRIHVVSYPCPSGTPCMNDIENTTCK